MKKTALALVIVLAIATTFSSCKRDYEEFYFKAEVVGAEVCSGTTWGYLLRVEKPEGAGDTVTYGGQRHTNAVMAYRSPRRLKKGETVYGVAYRYKDFAALNCLLVPNFTLPEWALLSVDEKPEVIE